MFTNDDPLNAEDPLGEDPSINYTSSELAQFHYQAEAGVAISAAESQLGAPYIWGAEDSGSAPACAGPGNGEVLSSDVSARGPYPCTPQRNADAGDPGFDCSGLVQWSWGKAGVSIGRSTWDQLADHLPSVTLSSIQPGDLVFYEGGAHVGMYIGTVRGVPTIIQAPETGQVVDEVPIQSDGPIYGIRRP